MALTPGLSTGTGGVPPRMRRAVATLALSGTPRAWSSQSHSAYVAKPSLSQMSRHAAGLTSSPNHWCASSWASVVLVATRSVPNTSGENRESVWDSNPNPLTRMSGTTTPYSWNGYGPNSPVKKVSIAAVSATAGEADAWVSGEYASRRRTPPG